jgi:small subunit ribosomal protein S6
MRKYEAMFIIKPDLSEEEKGVLFNQLNEAIIKNKGNVVQSGVWSEKRSLIFPIKKYSEGIYYLVNFTLEPAIITELRNAYKLNEGILRVLITKTG